MCCLSFTYECKCAPHNSDEEYVFECSVLHHTPQPSSAPVESRAVPPPACRTTPPLALLTTPGLTRLLPKCVVDLDIERHQFSCTKST